LLLGVGGIERRDLPADLLDVQLALRAHLAQGPLAAAAEVDAVTMEDPRGRGVVDDDLGNLGLRGDVHEALSFRWREGREAGEGGRCAGAKSGGNQKRTQRTARTARTKTRDLRSKAFVLDCPWCPCSPLGPCCPCSVYSSSITASSPSTDRIV